MRVIHFDSFVSTSPGVCPFSIQFPTQLLVEMYVGLSGSSV